MNSILGYNLALCYVMNFVIVQIIYKRAYIRSWKCVSKYLFDILLLIRTRKTIAPSFDEACVIVHFRTDDSNK